MIYALLAVCFLIGSIPTGLLIAKNKGLDLREVGSGNIGATNVLRALGRKEAVLTLLGDIGKGAVAVALAKAFSFDVLDAGLAGVAAIVGHNFSIFLKLRGGKGVATSLGVLLVYSPFVGLCTIILWLLTARLTRYSSLSALVSFGLLPFSFYFIDPVQEKIMIAVFITVMLYIRHIANIQRLIKGEEGRIGQK